MSKEKKSAEEQVAEEAKRRAYPNAAKQTISDSQAEPEFQKNRERLKAERLAREATEPKAKK
jgi:hypothetical protein